MSRKMCNLILAISAAISLVVTLLVISRDSPTGPGVVLELLGKWLLLWTVSAAVIGILAEAVFELAGLVSGGRTRRSGEVDAIVGQRAHQV